MTTDKAHIVLGLGFGDEAKGSIVDYLARKNKIKSVVRFSGGSQCNHNVVTPDNKHHGFSQVGSGFFAGAETFLSRYTLIDPILLGDEISRLNAYDGSVIVDEEATVITYFHVLANRIQSLLKDKDYSTCGNGIGETRMDELNGLSIKVKDLKNGNYHEKLNAIKCSKEKKLGKLFSGDFLPRIIKWYDLFSKTFTIGKLDFQKDLIFEGAQGVLLDEKYGFQPYTTWTDTTSNNALKLLKNFEGEIIKYGLIRTYMTRHGSGPFVTEDKTLNYPEKHNSFNDWQGNFRLGHLDLIAVRYAIEVCGGIDKLVVSHMDYLPRKTKVCVRYKNMPEKFYRNGRLIPSQSYEMTKALFGAVPQYREIESSDFLGFLEGYLDVEIDIVSFGEKYSDKYYKHQPWTNPIIN